MAGRYDYRKMSLTSKEFVKREINENPVQINAHIESLKKWVMSMPHLNCPTDAEFLLKFLRVAKFDHAKAQMRLDNFCTVRSAPRGYPEMLKLFDIDDPVVKYFLDQKFLVPLGQNEARETILLFRIKAWDPDVLSWRDTLRLIYMGLNIIMMDEAAQIYGIKMILDFGGVTRKAMEGMGDPKDIRASYRILQDSFPLRIKSQIFYNEPAIFDILFKIISFFLNDKLKSRVSRFCASLR